MGTLSRPRYCDFDGLKSASLVRAVTEGLVLGLTATAESDRFFACRPGELVTQVIDDFNGSLDDERSIFAEANDDRFSHEESLHREDDGQLARYLLVD